MNKEELAKFFIKESRECFKEYDIENDFLSSALTKIVVRADLYLLIEFKTIPSIIESREFRLESKKAEIFVENQRYRSENIGLK